MFSPQSTFQAVLSAIKDHRSVFVIGTWGSGKTTLLREICQNLGTQMHGKAGNPHDLGSANPTTDPIVVDDTNTLSSAMLEALAAQISDGAPGLVSIAACAEYPAELHRSLHDCDALVVRLGPLSISESQELCSNLGFELGASELFEIHHRSGGISLVTCSLLTQMAERKGSGHTLRDYSKDLAAVTAGMRAELNPATRRIFDALSTAERVSAAVAGRLYDPWALDFGQAMGIFRTVHTEDGPNLEVSAPALAEAGRSLLGAATQRQLLLEILEVSKELEPPQPSLGYRIIRARWCAQVDGDLAHIRNGLGAAIINANFHAAIELGRHVLQRDRSDLTTAHSLSIAYEALGDHLGAAEISRLLLPTSDASWRMRNAADHYLAHPHSGPIPPLDEDFSDDPLSEAVAHRSWIHLFSGAVSAADQDATQVLSRQESSSQAIVWAALAQAGSRVTLGGGPSALEVLDYAQRFAQSPGVNPFASLQLGLTRALVQIRSGTAEAAYRETSAAAEAIAAVPIIATGWHGFAALAAREIGEYALSLSHFQKSLTVQNGDPFGLGTLTQSEVATCHAMLGSSAVNDQTTKTSDPVGLFAPLVLRNEAWCAAANGEVKLAQERLLRAADLAAGQGQLTHEILALVDLARFGRASHALERIRLIQCFENSVVRIGAQVISALSDCRAEGLHQATKAARSTRWGTLQDELALLTVSKFQRRGDTTKAARLELAWMPARWPTPICRAAEDNVLTSREAELGSLAAQGRSTPEIAAALQISPRTVDNLLGRLYMKCAVSGRIELSEMVREEAAF
jgi:DNA-binding CsgD family transcriptional regulator